MTQRQLYHQSPHSVGDSSKSWEPRETAQPVDGSTGWTVSFLSASVGLNVFQTAGMRLALLTVFLAAQLPFIWEGLSAFIVLWHGRNLVYLISFRDHFGIFWGAFLPKELPFRVNEGWYGSMFQYWRKLAKLVPIHHESIHCPKRINKISPLSMVIHSQWYITTLLTVLAMTKALNFSLENSRKNSIIAEVERYVVSVGPGIKSPWLNSKHFNHGSISGPLSSSLTYSQTYEDTFTEMWLKSWETLFVCFPMTV